MQQLETDGAYLEGLENRFKRADSLSGKILADAEEKHESLDVAAAAISVAVFFVQDRKGKDGEQA